MDTVIDTVMDTSPRADQDLPFVSIVLPIRNERASIEGCLASIAAQEYPPELMELLVVDGMSTDGTRQIVKKVLNGKSSLSGRLLDNPKLVVPAGLNVGILAARGSAIVRVDGHTILAPDYVRQGIDVLMKTGAKNVGGLMTPVGEGLVGEAIALAHNLRFGLGGGSFHLATEETDADTVYMGIFRREVFDRVGLFDEDLIRNQDIELNGRIRSGGGRVVLSPRVRSIYHCRSSLGALWKQNYANGKWLLRTWLKNHRALSVRHFVPLGFVLALGLAVLACLLWPGGWPALVLLVGAYALCSLAASIRAASEHGWRYAAILPAVFATLHVSYGAGSLAGIRGLWRGRGAKGSGGQAPR